MDELDQIRQKIDIVSFISEYLPLKKAGRNFKVNCPFHNEKTPSFVVSPERQIFHCFGCGAGGDIFTFLMKYENLEFPEALRILAKRAGVELKRRVFDTQASKTRERLYEINHLASEFYHYLLTAHSSGKKAQDYLRKRGISEESIKTWKLGFAPNLWDSLIKFLVGKKKYQIKELEEAGLVVPGKDRFRNRIIFPLTDHRGNIVGFSGRLLEDPSTSSGQAKYINTPETLIYHKGDLFYGLDKAREVIKKEDSAILVEGEFDVIQSFQNSVKNVIAIKGTALTQNQAGLISRFTENINLCLDKDSAGELANKRGIEILENAGLQVKIIKVPGKDPDESWRGNSVPFKKAIKNPIPIYDFILESALSRFDAKEASGKKKISDEVIPFLVKITNEIIKNHYLKKLSQTLEVSEEAVFQEIEKLEKKLKASPVAAIENKKGEKRDRGEILAEYLLALVLQQSAPEIFLDNITSSVIINPLYQKIFQLLRVFSSENKFSIKKFIEFVPSELIPAIDRSFLLTLPDNLSEEKFRLEIEKTIRELEILALRKNMDEIVQKIKLAEKEKKERELRVLKETFSKLTSQLQEVKI